MSTSTSMIYTVGHSTHPLPTLVSLLQKHHVTAVADVRSAPYSRMNPQYNREALASALKLEGVQYVFLGKELGARSDDPACFEGGKVRYERIAKTKAFQAGIERVITGSGQHCIAMMCAEKDPLDCHRCVLVAHELVARGCKVSHILSDGRAEPHEDTMLRLLKLTRTPEHDLLSSPEEQIKLALRKREARIAYVEASESSEKRA